MPWRITKVTRSIVYWLAGLSCADPSEQAESANTATDAPTPRKRKKGTKLVITRFLRSEWPSPLLELERGGDVAPAHDLEILRVAGRSEEHTSELQSLMRISYAVFCLKKKKNKTQLLHRLSNIQVE